MSLNKNKIDYSRTYDYKNGKQTIKDSYVIDRKTRQHTLVSRDVKNNPPPKK